MATRRSWLLSLLALTGLLAMPVQALELNQRQGPGPAEQAKVGKALARSYRLPTSQTMPRGQADGCGNTSIGTIAGANRSSRIENIVAVRGDIITVNRNTRCR